MLLLDLCCGAGGSGVGYKRAGYTVVGVDNRPQPRFPFEFVQADALDAVKWFGRAFDLIHASPPCQHYSHMTVDFPDEWPDLIAELREELERTGRPFVIENVRGAPLKDPIVLCGHMFGLDLYRHRYFETNWKLPEAPSHPTHVRKAAKAGRWSPGQIISVVGNCAPIEEAKRAMGIDWMTRHELTEAIPPAYTEWIGRAFRANGN